VPNRRRRTTRSLIAMLAVALAVAGFVGLPTDALDTSRLPAPMRSMGVFAGSGNPNRVREFEQRAMAGSQAKYVLEHVDMRDWNHVSENGWFLSMWRGSGKKLVISVGPMPWNSGANNQAAVSGAYDGYWRKQLQQFVDYGFGDAILRVGHEMNCCYPWAAAPDPQAYINMYRRYVSIARSIPGQRFLFDWNPVFGGGNMSAAAAYPGDDVVDIIGIDIYDDAIHGADPVQRWNNMLGGLQWHRDFANAHDKFMSYPEWGLSYRPLVPSRSGGDNPYFIARMKDWFASNNVAYAIYYSHDNYEYESDILNGDFPAALSEFNRQFGAPIGGSTPPPPAPPAPPASGTPSAPTQTPQAGSGPSAPTNFGAEVSNGQVTLSWTPSPGADGYNIFRDGQHIDWPLDPMLSSYVDTPSLGTHSYFVRAYNHLGNGNATPLVTVNTSVNSGGSSGPTAPPPTTTTTTAPPPAPPVPPSGSGGSGFTGTLPTTPTDGIGPAAPTNLAASVANGKVTLTWTPSPGADGYNIFRDGQHIAWPLNPGLSSYADTPSAGNHTYYVRAYNALGNGRATAAIGINAG
jgi:Glycosyl hydrolase family 26